MNTLRRGSMGPDVVTWLQVLSVAPRPTLWTNSKGEKRVWTSDMSWPIPTSFLFDHLIEAATEAWQFARRLSADGVVGPLTWKAAGIVPEKRAMDGTIPFVQAKHYYKGGNYPSLIVIHDMEYPERPGGAEWCAGFFASGSTAASAHYCLSPETRVLFADLIWRPIGDVREGHELVATEEHAPGMSGRTMQLTDVTRAKRRKAECVRITFSDGREVVCSTDHRWLAKPPVGGTQWDWRAAEQLVEGCRLLAPLRPWEQRFDRDAGYLEGIYDGEGCWSSNGDLSFAQKRGAVLDRAHGILNAAGIPYRLADQRDNGVVVTDLSGLQATLQVGGQFRPQRLIREPRWVGRALRSRTHSNHVMVATIEHLGIQEVVSIETSRHTFFAEGIVSHNCVDNDSTVQCVRDEDGAWHTPGALPAKGGKEINRRSIGIEHAGYAKQTAEEWLDDYSMAMLTRSAELVARLCVKYGIPPVRLTAEGVRLGAMGICGHVDCTKATGVGSHWDPGPGFPWDWYMARVKANHNLLIGSAPVVADVVAADGVSEPLDWPIVRSEGVDWYVAPEYIWPISIGGAADLAKTLRCELPTPSLVNAIWEAADLKIDAAKMARSDHNGTAAQMASLHMFNSQAELLEQQIGGRPFTLLDGNCKNIVELNGVIGIYGAHRANGKVIQSFYPRHALGWIDYFQGLRCTRRV